MRGFLIKLRAKTNGHYFILCMLYGLCEKCNTKALALEYLVTVRLSRYGLAGRSTSREASFESSLPHHISISFSLFYTRRWRCALLVSCSCYHVFSLWLCISAVMDSYPSEIILQNILFPKLPKLVMGFCHITDR